MKILGSRCLRTWLLTIVLCGTATCGAADGLALTVEELRIDEARRVLSEVTGRFDSYYTPRLKAILQAADYDQAEAATRELGEGLWREATWIAQHDLDFDDRGLYWARMMIGKAIRLGYFPFEITAEEKHLLLEILENTSRGRTQLRFTRIVDKKIMLSGFDPFLLDRNITQSNPSGVIALYLDGKVIQHRGITAEINTFVVPVRYADFDDGEIESVLRHLFERDNIDLMVTVSMGRAHFDLERFPGRRRSATAPDNLNVYSGATAKDPKIPLLEGKPLIGPEFVEFSLPAVVMKRARGAYGININQQVTTTEDTFIANSLSDLVGAIAVRGAGGGYLSNEISYRSIRLRNELNSTIPTGHIHTPRISEFDADVLKKITEQLTEMLRLSLTSI